MYLEFGKYKNKHLSTITDRNYLEWVVENVDILTDEQKQAISNRIVNLPQPIKKTPLDESSLLLLEELLQKELNEIERNIVSIVLQYRRISEKQSRIIEGLLKRKLGGEWISYETT